MRLRPLILGRLFLRFFGHCLLSGISTARIILQRTPPPAGFVRFDFAPMSITGAAVLGALVTLTPGSSAIDIDTERREILLHLLDTRLANESIEAIRRDFEHDISLLFPEVPA
jgi:multicomponent K+:H+ antiporter subunit E/multicomponent Na+:H+ antiporter subunit E